MLLLHSSLPTKLRMHGGELPVARTEQRPYLRPGWKIPPTRTDLSPKKRSSQVFFCAVQLNVGAQLAPATDIPVCIGKVRYQAKTVTLTPVLSVLFRNSNKPSNKAIL